jgi:septal ring factor EnvC (AmiA/AmiB activator)
VTVDPVSEIGPGPSCGSTTPRTPHFNFSKTKKRKISESSQLEKPQNEIKEMRQKEHELRMEIMECEHAAARAREEAERMKLEANRAERDYWQERSRREFAGYYQNM